MKKEQVQDSNEFKEELINEEPVAEVVSDADSFTAENVSEGASDTGAEVKRLQDLADEYQGQHCVHKLILITSVVVPRRKKKSWLNMLPPSS